MADSNPILAGRVPNASFNTQLDPGQEQFYRMWVAQNKVPTNPDVTAPQDYDMRGFYQGLQQQNPKAQSGIDPNDGRMHYPDFWKTPLHDTFSNESQWAPANAPQWSPDDKLMAGNGKIVYDDKTSQPDPDPNSMSNLVRALKATQ